ncbi:MAG TPA: hypothetical protein VIP98_09235 [Microlunatus sp.]
MTTPDPPEPETGAPLPDPPREPFAYMSGPNRIREPWFLIITFGLTAAFGIWVMINAVLNHHHVGGLMMAATFMVVLVGCGGIGLYVGIRRLIWKHNYRRTMGENPW